jgi:hypothetical protein
MNDGTVGVATMDGETGTLGTIVRVNSPAFPSGLAARPGGGFVLALNQFVGTSNNQGWVVAGDEAGIDLQVNVSGAFTSVNGVAVGADKIAIWGATGPTGGSADGYVAAFALDGTPIFDTALGTGASFRVATVIPRADDFVVIGMESGEEVLTILDAGGAATATIGYDDSRGAPNYLVGGGLSAGGGAVLCGVDAAQGFWNVTHTAPDFSMDGCADLGFGASLPTTPSVDADIVVATSSLGGSSVVPDPSVLTARAFTVGAQPGTNLCE